MGYGQAMTQRQGTAASGWGLGTTPYAVSPSAAPNTKPTEKRQGNKSLKDTPMNRFEPLYSPEDMANKTYDTNVQGQLDLLKSPEKIEEIRSAPDSQQALTQYVDVIGNYSDSEESAIDREEVPLEYQELVKQYFDEIQRQAQAAKAKDAKAKSGGKSTKDKPKGK